MWSYALINSQYILLLYLKYWYYKEKFDSDLKGSRVTGFHAPMQPCMLSLRFIFCIYLICTWAGLNVPSLVYFMYNGISQVHVNTEINIIVMTKIKNNLCQWLTMCKKYPRNRTMNFEGKNGLNFRLTHRKAQKAINNLSEIWWPVRRTGDQ